jgi:hypothetical protein
LNPTFLSSHLFRLNLILPKSLMSHLSHLFHLNRLLHLYRLSPRFRLFRLNLILLMNLKYLNYRLRHLCLT